jgi:hypothetical protein
MCNLYSITKGQAAIIEFTSAMRDDCQHAAAARHLPRLQGTRCREPRRRS